MLYWRWEGKVNVFLIKKLHADCIKEKNIFLLLRSLEIERQINEIRKRIYGLSGTASQEAGDGIPIWEACIQLSGFKATTTYSASSLIPRQATPTMTITQLGGSSIVK